LILKFNSVKFIAHYHRRQEMEKDKARVIGRGRREPSREENVGVGVPLTISKNIFSEMFSVV
jgi:hypothetical protein